MECFRYGPGAPRRRRYWRPGRPALWVRRAGPADAPGRPGAVFSPLQFPLCLVMASEDLPACRPVERPCGPPGPGRGHVLRGAPVRSLPFLCPLCSLRPLRSPDRTGLRPPGTRAGRRPLRRPPSPGRRGAGRIPGCRPRPLRPSALRPAESPFCPLCPQSPVGPFWTPGWFWGGGSRGLQGCTGGSGGPAGHAGQDSPSALAQPSSLALPQFLNPLYINPRPRGRERERRSVYIYRGCFFLKGVFFG